MSPELKTAIENAGIEDLLFSETPFIGHSSNQNEKIGYMLVSVQGVPVSSEIKISYVKGDDGNDYWYLPFQSSLDKTTFESEVDAKASILKTLKRAKSFYFP